MRLREREWANQVKTGVPNATLLVLSISWISGSIRVMLRGIQSGEVMQRIAQCDGNALPDSILIAQLCFLPTLLCL